MKRETCRFLLGIIITLMTLTSTASLISALIVHPKYLLLACFESIWMILGVILVEYANNKYGGNW